MSYTILPLGDSAVIVDFGNIISEEIHSQVISLASKIELARLPAIKDIIPAFSSIAIHYDPVFLLKKNNGKSAFAIMMAQIEKLLKQPVEVNTERYRSISIPVCYSLKYGLDLLEMSVQKKLPVEDIIRLHTSKKYRVYMIGFLPGFAYMGHVDEAIAFPRKKEPRQNIEAGSVGIAGKQTGIYPLPSPGGWQIIGKTPMQLFDKTKEPPVFLKAGDEVTFYPITENEFDHY